MIQKNSNQLPTWFAWLMVLGLMCGLVYLIRLEASKQPDPNWIPTISDEELEKIEYGKKEKTKS